MLVIVLVLELVSESIASTIATTAPYFVAPLFGRKKKCSNET